MRESGIQLDQLETQTPDAPFGLGSGAASIYGVTGGVAEAVVRYCIPDKSENALQQIEWMGLRGDAPFREATIHVGDTELKLAIVNGLVHVKKLLKEIEEGRAFYHLIEVMTCQGGCVGGAGQPRSFQQKKKARGEGLYRIDHATEVRRAERNPIVVQMLAEMGAEKAHELLHVDYRNHKETIS